MYRYTETVVLQILFFARCVAEIRWKNLGALRKGENIEEA